MDVPSQSPAPSKDKPSRQKANPTQLAYLAEYMKNHSEMVSGLGQTPKGRITFEKGWAKLAHDLDSLGPPVKDVLRWKQAWRDMRNNVKKKVAHNKVEYRGYGPGSTGNEPPLIISLAEQQVLGIMGPVTDRMEEVLVTEVDIKRASPPKYLAPAQANAAPTPMDEPVQPIPPPKSSRKRTRPIVENFNSKLLKIEEGKLRVEQKRNIIFNRMVNVLQGISNKLDKLLEK